HCVHSAPCWLILSLRSRLPFFVLLLRRPPRSSLFPTRRSSDLLAARHLESEVARGLLDAFGDGARGVDERAVPVENDEHHRRMRSEEHTSELQSHLNLVCRLLLEKKNKQLDERQESQSPDHTHP